MSARLAWTHPAGGWLPDPVLEQLAPLFGAGTDDYWRQGSGEASCGPLQMVDGRWTPVAGRGIELLVLSQPEPGRWFLVHMSDAGHRSPHDGVVADDYLETDSGGDPFFVPRACLLDAGQALAVLGDWLASGGAPSPRVLWADWEDLQYPPEHIELRRERLAS